MSAAVSVRAMREEDVDAVCAIAAALPSAPKWKRENYERAIRPGALPERIALVAELENGALAGFAIASLVLGDAELETICVAPEAQRGGAGKSLLDRLTGKALEHGAGKMQLEVRESNKAALALYHSAGFVESGRRRRYYSDPEEDAILLACYLR